jgi:non-homologous end joining protein Ku
LLYNGTHLYLQPKASTAEFSAIVSTLTRLRRHGIGTLNFNGRRHLVAVAARSGLLIVHSLHYPELLRAVPDCFSLPTTELTHRNAAAEKVANAKKNRVDWDGYCDPAPEIMRRILANASKKNGRSERVRLPRQQVAASSKKTSVEAKRSNRGPQSGVRA